MGIWMAVRGLLVPKSGIAVTTEVYSERIGEVLRAKYGELRHASKRIARLADASDRAARKWMGGECGPHVSALILLMAREPVVAAAVQQMVDQQRQLDAELAMRRARRTDSTPP